MSAETIEWSLSPLGGRAPVRFAGAGATFGLYLAVVKESAGHLAGGDFEAVLKTVQLSPAEDSMVEQSARTGGVEVGFPLYFKDAPDWDLLIDESGNGAAVMQTFGGAWNDLLYVSLPQASAPEPVLIRGQNLTSPRLAADGSGAIRILARSDLEGLVLIDPARPADPPKKLGNYNAGLGLDIGGGENAWLFLDHSMEGPLSANSTGAAPVELAIGPAGKIPKPAQTLFEGAQVFEVASASTGNGLFALATAPDGVHASSVDSHGTETALHLDHLAGILTSPSVTVQSASDGGVVALMSVLVLDAGKSVSSIAFAHWVLPGQ